MEEWRNRTVINMPGHYMEIIPDYEMGGGISRIQLFCWSCDTIGGHAIDGCSFWEWPGEKVYTPNEAMIHLRKQAWRHYKGREML